MFVTRWDKKTGLNDNLQGQKSTNLSDNFISRVFFNYSYIIVHKKTVIQRSTFEVRVTINS